MRMTLSHVNHNVPDLDEAAAYYTSVLGMTKTADIPFGEGNRWLTIAFNPQDTTHAVLYVPSDPSKIGTSEGWVLNTDDCRAAYETLKSHGVEFQQPPTELPWGIQAQFTDKYGYKHVMVQQPAAQMTEDGKPALSVVFVELPARDLNRAVGFYQKVFDLKPGNPYSDGERSTYTLFSGSGTGHPGISLNQTKNFDPTGNNGVFVYLNGKYDLDTTLDRAVSAGGVVILPKTAMGDWGCYAIFADTEGNHLGLFGS
jgi:predicted enzyme related to lactoylglutathione lyase